MSAISNISEALKLNFTIVPSISEDDIEQLALIHVHALRDDPSASVKFETAEEFQGKVEDMLRVQINVGENRSDLVSDKERIDRWTDPDMVDCLIVKAVLQKSSAEKEPEKIVGWASWLREEVVLTEPRMDQPVSDKDESIAEEKSTPKLFQHNPGLGIFMRGHQMQLYADWNRRRYNHERDRNTRTRSFLSLRSVFVDPNFQRRGIGAALVRYGCERADRLQLDTLVTATPTAKVLYEKVGAFQVFDSIEIDLNTWVRDDRQESLKSQLLDGRNLYCFWFMARPFSTG